MTEPEGASERWEGADSLGCFVPGSAVHRQGASGGLLSGLTFAAKDIFDIAGHVSGFGNPDWLRTHEAAKQDAPCIAHLLDAGAELVGKTITDELAYSIGGQNPHYGAPTNVNAPGCTTGGSSSGSAAAVAGGLVDFSIGSDTGGSVRIPGSYCGLFGIRPSHGRVSVQGVLPLARSFDTVGWFARDAELLARVGEILLADRIAEAPPPVSLFVALDAFGHLDEQTASAFDNALGRLGAQIGKPRDLVLGEPYDLNQLMEVFRILQGREIWAEHGDWITKVRPTFGADVGERIAWIQTLGPEQEKRAQHIRDTYSKYLRGLLGETGVIVLPSTAGIAPRLGVPAAEMREHRSRTLTLTSPAGLAGLPQITLPVAQQGGCPLGLSLIGPGNGDAMLLGFAAHFTRELEGRFLPFSP